MVIISGVPIFRIFTVDPEQVAHYELFFFKFCRCKFCNLLFRRFKGLVCVIILSGVLQPKGSNNSDK